MFTILGGIYFLLIAAAVCFVAGAFGRFIGKHEATVWWRGTMGFLGFAQALLLLEILNALSIGP